MPFLSDILLMLLSLPVVLMALSVHESAHGYAAYKLGDPTAHSLGRITLNPVKHFDLFGFLSMLIFHIGWAKPVPVNARYFKNPRRDFAIVGAAGPLSNLCLAVIHLLILRLFMIFTVSAYRDEAYGFFERRGYQAGFHRLVWLYRGRSRCVPALSGHSHERYSGDLHPHSHPPL